MVLIVRSRQHWDVKCPPKKKRVIAGKLVPTVRGMMPNIHRKKRIVIEVHGHEQVDDEAVVPTAMEPPSSTLPTKTSEFLPNDIVVFRILKPRRHWGLSRDVDSDSSDDDDDDEDSDEDLGSMEEAGWIEYRKFDLDEIDPDEKKIHHETTLELQLGRGSREEVREFKFPTPMELHNFDAVMDRLTNLMNELAEKRAEDLQEELKRISPKSGKSSTTTTNKSSEGRHQSSSRVVSFGKPFSEEEADDAADVNLLVEIVSATDLPIADMNSSDPYVVVWMGTREVHRTKHIPKTLDPIWTVENGSIFILSASSRDFFQSQVGLTFLIKDYDSVGGNEVLGRVNLSQKELMTARGERVEYPLLDLLNGFSTKKVVHAPKLNIRVRPASKEDFKFVKTLHKVASKKKLGVYAEEAFISPASHPVNRLKRETKVGFDGKRLQRVKPGPDPARPEVETKWLTSEQIEKEHLKPSKNWIETGSGSLGRVYLEILRCDGLPNLDSGLAGDKTDAFCSIIYEDAIANTDVINDELGPRWMPWSQRAFLFHMQHSSSQILIGVFDWDGLGANDPIGRVTIDITNFYDSTDYLLTYNLFESVLDEERSVRGTLTVRVRKEMTGTFQNVVMSCLKGPPPANFVNVTKKEDFRSARFVTCGEENMFRLDMDALKSYLRELQEYQDILYYIHGAFHTVLLWRGHYPVNICGCKFKLAVHSFVAFVMGVVLAENLNLFPSFLFFCLGWLMLATNEERQRNPSPWYKSASFGEMWHALIFGKRTTKHVVTIDDELKPLIDAYEEQTIQRRTEISERNEKLSQHGTIIDEYFAQEEVEAAEEEANMECIETKTGHLQLNPLKPILMPIQKILAQVCVVLRVIKSFVVWEESVYSFLLTNACFVCGVLLLFIPWGWLLRWTFRIVVWVFLGPWMKLVDIFVLRKLKADGDNLVKRLEAGMEERSRLLLVRKRTLMMQKEDATKLRATKRYMFGRFVARVPQFKEYRFPDIPLPNSVATPHDDTTYSAVNIVERKHGQRLVGHMIPSWGDEGESAILSIEEKSSSGSKRQSREGPMGFFRRSK